ncbi:MAG: hypothetical protein KME26_01170 [Oscillatoria princeps RMCB-10]|nr:hypothetical protein [Oscillatoria princeps RMCB-10]
MQSGTICEVGTPKRDGSQSRSSLTGFLRVPVGSTIPHATASLATIASEIATPDWVVVRRRAGCRCG